MEDTCEAKCGRASSKMMPKSIDIVLKIIQNKPESTRMMPMGGQGCAAGAEPHSARTINMEIFVGDTWTISGAVLGPIRGPADAPIKNGRG